jgi:ferredoxin
LLKWVEQNREYAAKWPNITVKKPAAADADDYKGKEGKFEQYFSPNPGTGSK